MPSLKRKGHQGPEVTAPRNRPVPGRSRSVFRLEEHGMDPRPEAALRISAAAKQSNRLLEDKEIAAPARGDEDP